MNLTFVPLLQTERELHDIPRGMERFNTYLKTTLNGEGDDVDLVPLIAMNPMSREHVAQRLDELIAMGAEDTAAEATREAEQRLAHVDGDLRVGLVIMDDVRGGWTNHYLSEAGFYFGNDRLRDRRTRSWVSVPLWVSETPSRERVRESTLAAIYRTIHSRQHAAKTLRQIMAQEGRAALFAGQQQWLDADDLDYTRQVIAPHLDATDYPTQFACLFGDEAAREVGYPPMGLSPRAGFALALEEAQQSGVQPEDALTLSVA